MKLAFFLDVMKRRHYNHVRGDFKFLNDMILKEGVNEVCTLVSYLCNLDV